VVLYQLSHIFRPWCSENRDVFTLLHIFTFRGAIWNIEMNSAHRKASFILYAASLKVAGSSPDEVDFFKLT
jgi:hypothetical protein